MTSVRQVSCNYNDMLCTWFDSCHGGSCGQWLMGISKRLWLSVYMSVCQSVCGLCVLMHWPIILVKLMGWNYTSGQNQHGEWAGFLPTTVEIWVFQEKVGVNPIMKKNIASFTELGLAARNVEVLVFLRNLRGANPLCGIYNTGGNIHCCNFTIFWGWGAKKR